MSLYKKGKKLRVIELFAGMGMQSIGLDIVNIPHETIAISEVDIHALLANAFVNHDLEEEMKRLDKDFFPEKEEMIEFLIERNIGINFETGKNTVTYIRDIEKLKRVYLAAKLTNNLGDISNIKGTDLPKDINIMTYSFPCQDLSSIGSNKGLFEGERSSLVKEVFRLVSELKDLNNEPDVLVLENVANLNRGKHKEGFNKILEELENLGYENYYRYYTGNDVGLTQHRKRIYVISIKKDIMIEPYELPEPIDTIVPYYKMLLPDVKVEETKPMFSAAFDKSFMKKSFDMVNRNSYIRYRVAKLENPYEVKILQSLTTQNVSLGNPYVVEPITGLKDMHLDKYKNYSSDNLKNFIAKELGFENKEEHLTFLRKQKPKYRNQEMHDKLEKALNIKNYGKFQTFTFDGAEYRIRYLTPFEGFTYMGIPKDKIEKINTKYIVKTNLNKIAGNGLIPVIFGNLIANLYLDNEEYLQTNENWIYKHLYINNLD